jgi:hypothetical protein
MATVSGSHRVHAFWNHHRRAYVMYIIYLSLSSTVGVLIIYLPKGGMDERGYFDSVGGCWTTRTPAIRAGLNDRSQSAYAAPAPKPVERAMGHARPEINLRFFFILEWMGVSWLSRTAEEDDRCNDTNAEADTTERRKKNVRDYRRLWYRVFETHDFTSKSATMPRHVVSSMRICRVKGGKRLHTAAVIL